jgi:hypothetical protein
MRATVARLQQAIPAVSFSHEREPVPRVGEGNLHDVAKISV